MHREPLLGVLFMFAATAVVTYGFTLEARGKQRGVLWILFAAAWLWIALHGFAFKIDTDPGFDAW